MLVHLVETCILFLFYSGVDDAFAIAMALRLAPNYNYEIKLLTTLSGNCHVSQVNKNVHKIRAACGCNSLSGPTIMYY